MVKLRGEKVSESVGAVQGSFVPDGGTGFFFLWAMESGAAGSGSGSKGALRPLPVEQLYRLLRGLPHVNSLTCSVLLPGRSGIRPAKVPGLALGPAAAARWLSRLDAACAGTGLQPGPSLRAWSAAAALLLDLLARGRFVPALRAEAGCLAAGWTLAVPEAEEARRLDLLESALPDLCRAVVPPGRSPGSFRPQAAGALLGAFLQAAGEALATGLLEGAPAPPPVAAGGRAPATQHWLAALSGRKARDLPPTLPDGAALYGAVTEWIAPVTAARGHEELRTGLRLLLPEENEAGNWELELFLQAEGEPPATAPARVIWEGAGQELHLGNRRYRQPERRLLTDLDAMSRLFPPLEPLCRAAAPSRLAVSLDDCVALLREGAGLLQQAGFPVHLPAGLVRPAPLKSRMHLKPAGGGAPDTYVGLNQLVEVEWDLALGDSSVSEAELRELAWQKRTLVMHQGRWVQVDDRSVSEALHRMESHREPMPVTSAIRLAPRVDETTGEGWVAEMLLRLREPARIERVPVPSGFEGELRPYQQRGLDWMAFLRSYGLGACLADDMGLGKTVQLIALLLHEREKGWTDRPTLLVCPVSLVGNWRREIAKFGPAIKVLIHHGAGRAGEADFAAEALQHDLVITTYALAARDEEMLAAVPWAGVVADEAQNVKNPSAKPAQALRRLPAGYRIALTGTPVENHLGDLWSLFHFLNPGYLGSSEEFRKLYGLPIERYSDEEAAARLRRLVRPFILRRVKTDPHIVDDLPEKLESTVITNLTLEQAALYEAVVQEMLLKVDEAVGIQRHGAVLAGLTRLKQICNHPAAVTHDTGPLAGRSGKLDRLTDMLQEVVDAGDRALIFTQFARFGARLQPYLERLLGCPVLFLDGSTARSERDRLIASFQAGEAPVFILSLKAGGVGLTLTAATQVFHFDRWWNPAVEDQATDRAYRIGQDRRVLVHKLVTAGTLEERIDRLLADKRALSDQVIGTGESWLGTLSTSELSALIRLEWE